MAAIGVVVPAFRAAATLDACLGSLVAQHESDWHAVVVDDGSPDDTAVVAEAWAARDDRIEVVRLPDNGGRSAARNVALDRLDTQYVTLLDADDRFDPRRLTVLAATAASLDDPRAVLLDDQAWYRNDAFPVGRVRKVVSASPLSVRRRTAPIAFDRWLRWRRCGQPFVRRDLVGDLRFPEDLACAEDVEFVAGLVRRGGRLVRVPFAGYLYRQPPSRVAYTAAAPPVEHSIGVVLRRVLDDRRLVGSVEASVRTQRALAAGALPRTWRVHNVVVPVVQSATDRLGARLYAPS